MVATGGCFYAQMCQENKMAIISKIDGSFENPGLGARLVQVR